METGKNGFASGFVLENKGQGEAWVHKRQCRTLTAEGPDHYLCAVRPTSIYPVTPNFLLLIRTLSSLLYTCCSAMISPPPSPKMARKLPGSDMENESQMLPPLSPKRSFAQDHLDPIDSKRRHVLLDGEVRTPLGESSHCMYSFPSC